ncbi:DUF551 domain-containing protein [Stutzerimonas nitrititolerans]|uniref:DUF551 domain-containing protein n=1 Tax=Stutzerimonas nitrititolerans TaxID=2482751 RepID=UPI003F80B6E8
MQAHTPEVSAEKATTPADHRLVSVEQLKKIHRDLDACQKVIWLAGCRPRGYGFDPSYVTDAQGRLKEIEALLEEPAPAQDERELPDYLNDAIDNLVHDNYERSQAGSRNRQADADLIRAALAARPAQTAPQGQSGWISVGDRLPDPEQHDRVLIFTDGSDFAGEQYFDVKAESLNENSFGDPDDQPEPYSKATHWMPLPLPTLSAPQPEQSGLTEVLCDAERFIAGFEGCELQEGIDELLMRIRAAQSELGGSHA